MSAIVGFSPSMQWSLPNGQLTPDAQRLLQLIIASNNGEGAGVTVDGTQTLSNKEIDGNSNTLTNIDTDSLETRTGDDEGVVTGTAGRPGFLGQWDENGDLVEGPETVLVVTSTVADETYVRSDGTIAAAGPIRMASYTVATVPTAGDYTQGLIYVSDESGGATPAFSDGTNWRRVADRAIIS